MSRKKPAHNRSRENELLGHLALAADQPSGPETCPGDEEIARFLEMQPGADERQRLLDHFSTCETCYQKWRDISAAIDAESQQQPSLLKKRSLLTAAGSACAVAVGVMLYLSIDYQPMVQPDKAEDKAVIETVHAEAGRAPAPATVAADAVQVEQAEEGLAEAPGPDEPGATFSMELGRTAGKAAARSKKNERMRTAVPEKSEVYLQPGEMKPLGNQQREQAVRPAAKVAGDRALRESVAPAIDEELAPPTDGAYMIEQFVWLCREDQLQSATVADLVEQGNSLLQAGGTVEDELSLIREITELLEQGATMEQTDFQALCERVISFGTRRGYHINATNSHRGTKHE